MTYEVINAEFFERMVRLVVQEFEEEYPYASRIGVLDITQGYLIEMLKNYRNGDLLSDIVWDEEE